MTSRKARICFLGDTYYGEFYQRIRAKWHDRPNLLETRGYDSFGAAIAPLLEGADIVVVNLETSFSGPLMKDRRWETPPFSSDRLLVANSTPTLRALMKIGVNVVSLGNNHAMDFGPGGISLTLTAVDKVQLRRLGAGRNLEEARRPLRFALDVGGKKVEVGLLAAYHWVEKYVRCYATEDEPGVNLLEEEQLVALRKDVGPDGLVIAYPHWGWNYSWRSLQDLKDARMLVRAGADVVLGHGAHMMGEVEWIDHHPVLYSLGNFIFNSEGEYQDRNMPPYSFVAVVELSLEGDRIARRLCIYPIISDNQISDFRPRPVNDKELEHVVAILRGHQHDSREFDARLTVERDHFGPHLVTSI